MTAEMKSELVAPQHGEEATDRAVRDHWRFWRATRPSSSPPSDEFADREAIGDVDQDVLMKMTRAVTMMAARTR